MIEFQEGNLRVPQWTRPVYMVAAGTSDFRKRYPEKKLEELTMMAFRMLLEENDLKMDPQAVKGLINFCCYGEFADHFQDQLLCEAKVHDYLGLDPLPNVGVKTGGATGGSTIAAIDLIKREGFDQVTVVSIVAAPEGLAAVERAHPDVQIYTAAIDECLNENKYIVPGLGDAGDRIFGTT